MQNDNQMGHPGEERHYGQPPMFPSQTPPSTSSPDLSTPNYPPPPPLPHYTMPPSPTTQDFGSGMPPNQPPERPKGSKIILVMSIVIVVLVVATGVLAFTVFNRSSTPGAQQTTPGQGNGMSTQSPTSTGQPSTLVPDGTITKNMTLTCGVGCNDPVHVTLNTIQIDNADGRMIWDNTLRDVTGSNSSGYNIQKYDLQNNVSQATFHAVLSQQNGNGTTDITAIFAFVPSSNVTYTLTVVVDSGDAGGVTMTFDPVKITF